MAMIMQDEMNTMPGADEEINAPDADVATDDVSTDDVAADEGVVADEVKEEGSI
ncbi:MAG: hypothetical protein V1684_02335 [bacterium]